MMIDEKAQYQADIEARDRDGNRRLEFRFKYWGMNGLKWYY